MPDVHTTVLLSAGSVAVMDLRLMQVYIDNPDP